MTEIYIDGIGTLEYRGAPKLSPVGRALFNLLEGGPGLQTFYRENGKRIEQDDVRAAILRATHPEFLEESGMEDEIFCHNKEAFLSMLGYLRIDIAQSYQDLIGDNDQTATPFEIVAAIVKDPESNLRAAGYEEATYATSMDRGEFGGHGAYVSHRVAMRNSTADIIQRAKNLDLALESDEEGSVEAELSVQLAEVLEKVVDLDTRERYARRLLAGEALKTVEDAVVNAWREEEAVA